MAFTYAKGMYTVRIGKSDPENTIMLEPNIARMSDGGIIASYTTGGNYEPDLRNVTKYRTSYLIWKKERCAVIRTDSLMKNAVYFALRGMTDTIFIIRSILCDKAKGIRT